MKEELMKLLPDLQKAVEQGVVYASDLFDRAILYYSVINIIGIIIGITLLTITLSVAIKNWTNKAKCDDLEDWLLYDGNIFWLLLMTPAVILLICSVGSYIQLQIIPEIFILQLLT